jgi:hypothetical protein
MQDMYVTTQSAHNNLCEPAGYCSLRQRQSGKTAVQPIALRSMVAPLANQPTVEIKTAEKQQ